VWRFKIGGKGRLKRLGRAPVFYDDAQEEVAKRKRGCAGKYKHSDANDYFFNETHLFSPRHQSRRRKAPIPSGLF
jgi:hypothetical protein